MHHHTDGAHVAVPALIAAANRAAGDEITRLLLATRRACTTGSPSDPYVNQLERDIKRDHAKPGHMLAAYLSCAVRDGADLDDVRAFALGVLDLFAADVPPSPPADEFPVACCDETVVDGALDQAQMRALRAPTRDALLAVEDAGRAQLAATRVLIGSARRARLGLTVASGCAPRVAMMRQASAYTVAA